MRIPFLNTLHLNRYWRLVTLTSPLCCLVPIFMIFGNTINVERRTFGEFIAYKHKQSNPVLPIPGINRNQVILCQWNDLANCHNHEFAHFDSS